MWLQCDVLHSNTAQCCRVQSVNKWMRYTARNNTALRIVVGPSHSTEKERQVKQPEFQFFSFQQKIRWKHGIDKHWELFAAGVFTALQDLTLHCVEVKVHKTYNTAKMECKMLIIMMGKRKLWWPVSLSVWLKGIVQHLGKYTYSLWCRELGERSDTTLMCVW